MTTSSQRTRWVCLAAALAVASPAQADVPGNGGPYNARFLPGGIGIARDLDSAEQLVATGHAFSLASWVRASTVQQGRTTLMMLGDESTGRRLVLIGGKF